MTRTPDFERIDRAKLAAILAGIAIGITVAWWYYDRQLQALTKAIARDLASALERAHRVEIVAAKRKRKGAR
jgi:vacuolar-type H+-ATPase catalytic subunit A/Vma1